MNSFANITEHFFVLDSDSLEQTESKLYGFVIDKTGFAANISHYGKFIDNKECGTYVNILANKNKIIIQQDYWGFFGLFLFREKEYFALSNSFFALVCHLYKKFNLEPDETYTRYFILEPLASFSSSRTPVRGIVQLPKNVLVSIKIKEKILECFPIDQHEGIYSVDSPETFEILDSWHNKFSCFLKQAINTQNVSFDLSGGFDSRLTLTISREHAQLLRNIRFNSYDDENHIEDLLLAAQLGNKFNFRINEHSDEKTQWLSYENSLLTSFYSKLGLHSNCRFYTKFYVQPIFNFSGAGGECLRGVWNGTQENFLQKYIPQEYGQQYDFRQCFREILQQSFAEIQKTQHSNTLSTLYKNTRMRSHFGKMTIEYLPVNIFWIAPLLDPMLYEISITNKKDPMLLTAVIFQRYFPELLSVRFDSGKKIEESTLKTAMLIQKKYPRKTDTFKNFCIKYTPLPQPSGTEREIHTENDFIKLIFRNNANKYIRSFFSDEVYAGILNELNSKGWYTDRKAKTALTMFFLQKMCREKLFDPHSPVRYISE